MVVANKRSERDRDVRKRDREVTKRARDLERALEGLFRLGANRRFDARQTAEVGAVVTRAGYAVLRSLADAGSASLREGAEASAMDSPTASRQVAQLRRKASSSAGPPAATPAPSSSRSPARV